MAAPVFNRGDRVHIVADEMYGGMEGTVRGTEAGMLTGQRVVNVQLDGRRPWDIEGFYVDQLKEPA